MKNLLSPWRLRYLAAGKRAPGCVFCNALRGRSDRAGLVLLRGRAAFVILNKYPYNNGHLMIVPKAHLRTLDAAPAETLHEMADLAARCERALRAAYRPSGINLGMNLGRSAGAGIVGHFHLHMVPRWDGDTNFMSVVHRTRVIPEALPDTYRRLRRDLRATKTEAPAARPAARRRDSRRRRGRS